MRQLKLMFSLDVNLYDGLPDDLTLSTLAAYLDMDVNDYTDGRHDLAVETFTALFDARPAMVRAIADAMQKRRQAAGETLRPTTWAADHDTARKRVDAKSIRHMPLVFRGVEETES